MEKRYGRGWTGDAIIEDARRTRAVTRRRPPAQSAGRLRSRAAQGSGHLLVGADDAHPDRIAGELDAIPDLELREDIVEMRLHRALGDGAALRHPGGAQPQGGAGSDAEL